MKKTHLKHERANTNDTPEKRLWGNVDKSNLNGCWLWLGATQSPGYGTLRMAGRKIFTHRLAYELANGSIGPNMDVCHKCDNPPCCNPAHLFLGTRMMNIHDSAEKGRMKRGSKHHNAKLNEGDVLEMRRLYQSNTFSQSKLAGQFGVSITTVNHILNRKTWKQI